MEIVFAQATSTTVRGIISWIKENCSKMPEIWSDSVKRATPKYDELLLIFTGLFYGPGSKKHKETLKQQIENKYPNLDQESKNLRVKEEEKLVCSNARYLKWLYTGSMNNIFNYIKINFDFDGLLTQNKDIVIRELQENKGAGAIIGISLLHNEHLRLKAFTDKINTNEIDYRTILKKENMREIGPQQQSSLMQGIQTPFRNYMDRTSDYMGKRYFSHAMTIVGYNLDLMKHLTGK